MRILVASLVRQSCNILKQFLSSLDKLDLPDHDFFFLENDSERGSLKLLRDFKKGRNCQIERMSFKDPYLIDDVTHHWSSKLVDNMMKMKRVVFDKALQGNYDYLFMIDSDMIPDPKLVRRLLSLNKDIVSEISWTKWKPDEPYYPNAWWYHNYGFPTNGLERLKKEKLLEVNGFGGLVLISKRALISGVNYDRVPGLNLDWGEDRHFSVRAKVLGFKLWIDTTSPVKHLYRDSSLEADSGVINPTGVLVAIPHTGSLKIGLADFLLKLFNNKSLHRGKNLGLMLNWGIPVDSNRNDIVQQFLKTNYEWLLMIDSDVVPPLNVLDMLDHEKKIVGATVMTATQNGIPFPVFMRKVKKGFKIDKKIKDIMKVDATGGACILIHRDVLEKIKSPFRLGYNQDGIVTEIGEDFDFCMKAKKIGYSTYVDTTIHCSHYKEVDLLILNKEMGKLNKLQKNYNDNGREFN